MKRRRFRSQRKSMYISFVICLAVFISVGYSYLSRTLNIAGNIAVSKTTWDVHFENATKIDGNIDLTNDFAYANNNTALSLGLALNEPGQYFEFEVDVVNNGTINAMLGSIIQDDGGVLTQNGRNNYLEYTITYDDGIPLTVKDSLPKKTTDKLKVRIAFKENVAESQLPSNDDNFQVTFKTTYVQDDGTSHEREHRKWTVQELIDEKANAATSTYTGVSDNKKKEMFTFNHSLPEAKIDYRYIGNTPNNYITFNEEIWRIIGVFDGKIKIMRDNIIENKGLAWDYKKKGLGSSTSDSGSNDWSDAQLMYLLNWQYVDGLLKTNYTKSGDLIKDTNGNVIYRLGYCPAAQANGLLTYTGTDSTTWKGLTETSDNQVAEVIWNLGGLNYDSVNKTYGTAEEMYQAERVTSLYNGRPATWTGKVALLYPSDYAYTFGKGIHDDCYRNTCECYSGSNVISGADSTQSWINSKNWGQWTLSPRSSTFYNVMSLGQSVNGSVNGGQNASDSYGVRPCVYLKSNIKLQGSGSSGDPYVIVE